MRLSRLAIKGIASKSRSARFLLARARSAKSTADASPARGESSWVGVTVVAWAIVFCAAYFPAAAVAADASILAERRAHLEQMDAAAKDQLRQKSERFAQLDPAERERLRALREQIEQDPHRAQLEQIMQQYSEWLLTLTPFQRAELADLEPRERVEMIKQIRDKQARESARRLSHEDVTAFSQWFVQRLIAHKDKLQLPPHMLRELENPDPREPLAIMGALFSPWAGRRNESLTAEKRPGEKRMDKKDPRDDGRGLRDPFARLESLHKLPPPTEEELASLKGVLSPQARGQLAAAKTPEDKQRLFLAWIGQAIRYSFSQRVSREELQRFFEKELPQEDQTRLLGLSKEDWERELRGLYFSHLRKQPGGPGAGGPWRGPEGRPRRPGLGAPSTTP